jgi:TPR repeat protein
MDQGQGNAAYFLGTMRWNGDGVARDHYLAASAWLVAAQHGNAYAPARLAKYYFTTSLVADTNQVRAEPATRTIYWATVATRVDPDSASRQESQKLIDMLLKVAPNLKPGADSLLANPGFPPL